MRRALLVLVSLFLLPSSAFATWSVIAVDRASGRVVIASATKRLPFSYFLTGMTATVAVRAQAAFEKGLTAPACLVAVDEHADGAITIGGSAAFIAGCGIKALSDAGKLGCDCAGASCAYQRLFLKTNESAWVSGPTLT